MIADLKQQARQPSSIVANCPAQGIVATALLRPVLKALAVDGAQDNEELLAAVCLAFRGVLYNEDDLVFLTHMAWRRQLIRILEPCPELDPQSRQRWILTDAGRKEARSLRSLLARFVVSERKARSGAPSNEYMRLRR
jgi:hypothetical protein